MNRIVCITGATSGIGKATAELLAKNNYNLIVTGRRKERLDELSINLEEKYTVKVLPINFDIRNHDEILEAVKQIPHEWKNIDVLINNAGLAVGLEHIDEGVVDDWDRMIDTNIKGLLYITREILPQMVRAKRGHIINIGSIAGKEAYENGTVYCATKFAVDALTKGMRIDLVKHGIKVTSICPGAAETEFSNIRFKGDDDKANKVYEGFTPLYAEDIAEAILFAVTRPPHVNINDMLIMATAQANATVINRENN